MSEIQNTSQKYMTILKTIFFSSTFSDSPCGQSADGKRSETGKTVENSSNLKRSYSSDNHTTKREIMGQHPNLNWKEKMEKKEERRHRQLDACSNVLPLQEKSWDHTSVAPELDGRHDTVSHDRKRPLESGSSINVKRVKHKIVEDQFEPSLLSTSHTMPVQHINMSDTSALYCYSSGRNVTRTPRGIVSYPGAEMYAYQNASCEQTCYEVKRMDHSVRQQLLGDYLLNSCKVVKIPHEAQNHKDVFHGFSAPHLHYPLAMMQQTAYLSGNKFINSGNESHHLQHCRHHQCHCATMSHVLHPGFLAASYMGC